jgi:hypothetical protein
LKYIRQQFFLFIHFEFGYRPNLALTDELGFQASNVSNLNANSKIIDEFLNQEMPALAQNRR